MPCVAPGLFGSGVTARSWGFKEWTWHRDTLMQCARSQLVNPCDTIGESAPLHLFMLRRSRMQRRWLVALHQLTNLLGGAHQIRQAIHDVLGTIED